MSGSFPCPDLVVRLTYIPSYNHNTFPDVIVAKFHLQLNLLASSLTFTFEKTSVLSRRSPALPLAHFEDVSASTCFPRPI